MRTFLRFVFVACVSANLAPSQTVDNPVAAARGVLERVLGDRAGRFRLELLRGSATVDEFEVSAKNGTVLVRGTSAVALSRGIYHYMRAALHQQYTWSGGTVTLPDTLPEFPMIRVRTPFKLRLYYNVCAFGYTTAFWSWEQWQREIDWMALHGVNMPLAMAGQEAVWVKVWKDLGLTENELSEYFTGPAFLPWHRMGNINKHGGPLPNSYIEGTRELQAMILRRMRELGMQPVVPAFSGYVPRSLKRLYPDAELIDMRPWVGFPEDNGTFMLSPLSPLFQTIGKAFLKEYRNEYGPSHFYLADAFNEMEVPVSKDGRYDELANFGRAIMRSIASGDTTGVWVMQGWLFYNDSKFWDKPSTQALLRDVPNDRMIIIDLSTERFHGWQQQDGFYGKEWIYSVIHNFGGNNQLVGDLPRYARDAAGMMSSSTKGALVGFGISPEGVENNEVVYEYLTDLAWSETVPSPQQWIGDYVRSRYGSTNPEIDRAWKLLLGSVYSNPGAFIRNLYQRRPGPKPDSTKLSSQGFLKAVEVFFDAPPLPREPRYSRDAVELAVQYAGLEVDALLGRALVANERKDASSRTALFSAAFELLREMDDVLASQPGLRLSRWVEMARAWGVTPGEKSHYEENAKRQVTTWGGPYLSEYACKVWSGLLRDYYLPRWESYADSLETGAPCGISEWEENWIRQDWHPSASHPSTDPVTGARELVVRTRRTRALFP